MHIHILHYFTVCTILKQGNVVTLFMHRQRALCRHKLGKAGKPTCSRTHLPSDFPRGVVRATHRLKAGMKNWEKQAVKTQTKGRW